MTARKNQRPTTPDCPTKLQIPARINLEDLAARLITAQTIKSESATDRPFSASFGTAWRPHISSTATSLTIPQKASPERRRRAPQGYITPTELAAMWRVCVDKVLAFIKSGELQAFNVASRKSKRPRYLITKQAIEDFEKSRRARSIPPDEPPPSPRRGRPSQPPKKSYF